MSEITGGRNHARVKVKSNDEATKAELRRWKNREAARRVRERKSNQLNTYKSQVDDLKRENQKLLQIIQQLQSATISPSSIAAPASIATTTTADHSIPAGHYGPTATAGGPTTATPSISGAPDSIDSNPSAAAAAAAATPPAGAVEQIGSANLTESQLQQQVPPPPLLEPVGSAPVGCAAVNQQQGFASGAVLSRSGTEALLPSMHSAPLLMQFAGKEPARPRLAPDETALLRACGCSGDEECEECEGIRVTILSNSNMPLVTTPGPKPKPLTLDDLCIPGVAGSRSEVAALAAAPAKACSSTGFAHNRDGGQQQQQMLGTVYSHPQLPLRQLQQQQRSQQGARLQVQKADQNSMMQSMDLDLVETLEPTRTPVGQRAGRNDSVSSSNAAVAMTGTSRSDAAAAAKRYGNSCYLRKGSFGTKLAEQQPEEQGKQKLMRRQSETDTASAAAAALASDPGLAAEFVGVLENDIEVTDSIEEDVLKHEIEQQQLCPGDGGPVGLIGGLSPPVDSSKGPQQQQQQWCQDLQQQQQQRDVLVPVVRGPTAADVSMGMDANAFELHQQEQQQQHHARCKKGNKLFRSLAAAVNTLVRPSHGAAGSSSSGHSGRHNANAVAAAAAAVALCQQQQQQQGVAGPSVRRNGSIVGDSQPGISCNGASSAAASLQLQQQRHASAAAAAAAVNACVPEHHGMSTMHEQIQQLPQQFQSQQQQQHLGSSLPLLSLSQTAAAAAAFDDTYADNNPNMWQSFSASACCSPAPMLHAANAAVHYSSGNGLLMQHSSSNGHHQQQQQQQVYSGNNAVSSTGNVVVLSGSNVAIQQQQQVVSGGNLSGTGNAAYGMQQQQQHVFSGSGNVASWSGSGNAVYAANGHDATLSGSLLTPQGSNAAAAGSTAAAAALYAPGMNWPGNVQAADARYSNWQQQQQRAQWPNGMQYVQKQGSCAAAAAAAGAAAYDTAAAVGRRGFSIIEGAAEGQDDDAVMQLAMQEGVLLSGEHT